MIDRDELLNMARRAGFSTNSHESGRSYVEASEIFDEDITDKLEAFARQATKDLERQLGDAKQDLHIQGIAVAAYKNEIKSLRAELAKAQAALQKSAAVGICHADWRDISESQQGADSATNTGEPK